MDLIALSLRLSLAGTVTIPAALRRERHLHAGMHVRLLLPEAGAACDPPSHAADGPAASIGLRIKRHVDRLDSWSIQAVRLPPESDAGALLALIRGAALRGSSPRWQIETLLDRFAVRCRRRILMGDEAESPEGTLVSTYERQRLPAWRFADGSYALRTRLTPAPPTFVSVAPDGLGQSLMLDRIASLRAALREDRTDLVAVYLQCHGELPRLSRTLLLRALQSPRRDVRLAALTRFSSLRARSGRTPYDPPCAEPRKREAWRSRSGIRRPAASQPHRP